MNRMVDLIFIQVRIERIRILIGGKLKEIDCFVTRPIEGSCISTGN